MKLDAEAVGRATKAIESAVQKKGWTYRAVTGLALQAAIGHEHSIDRPTLDRAAEAFKENFFVQANTGLVSDFEWIARSVLHTVDPEIKP